MRLRLIDLKDGYLKVGTKIVIFSYISVSKKRDWL